MWEDKIIWSVWSDVHNFVWSDVHNFNCQHIYNPLGTSHIIRKVLQSETGILSGGDRHWFKGRSAGEKRAATGAYNNNNNNNIK